MNKRAFGSIPGVPVGRRFSNRKELSRASVHRPLQAGICGTGDDGAESIVLSGGYEDDRDFGDTIIYTGHGGNDPVTKTQIADQELTSGNLALAVSERQGNPIRVVRRIGGTYRYDGLYRVICHWRERGISGFYVWRFKLVKIKNDEIEEPPADKILLPEPEELPAEQSEIESDSQPTDYSLYKCSECDKLVNGFSKKEHERMVHRGKAVIWKKIGK